MADEKIEKFLFTINLRCYIIENSRLDECKEEYGSAT